MVTDHVLLKNVEFGGALNIIDSSYVELQQRRSEGQHHPIQPMR